MKYWKYTIIQELWKRNNCRIVLVECECWNRKEVFFSNLKYWRTTSCNKWDCNYKAIKEIRKEHWRKLYWIWWWMINRTSWKDINHRYRKKWIIVCDKWKLFANFYYDMVGWYKKWLTLDRINNDWNYEPWNCRWATPRQQAENSSNIKMITYQWKTLSMTRWAEELWFPYTMLVHRFQRWWTVERALWTQKMYKKNEKFYKPEK